MNSTISAASTPNPTLEMFVLQALFGDLAADCDLEAGASSCLRGVDELRGLADRELRCLLGHRHDRERHLTRVRHLRARRCAVGRCDRSHIWELGHAGEHRLGARLDRRVGDASVLDGDHDLLTVAGGLGGGVLEQLERLEALRAVEAEAVVVRGTGALAERRQADHGYEPDSEHEPAVGDAPSGNGSHEVLRRLAAADFVQRRRRWGPWSD